MKLLPQNKVEKISASNDKQGLIRYLNVGYLIYR
ncbi:hypothetical protein NIES3806_30060 [Microcystis aeruginosa NIES-3806]|uniref:Uncharacterized protein n=2 Tax=Microcystis aeruginosa TaxID=1126 RepID=A0A6H9FTT8_MICAE|nr:hypothetical protein NIES3787_41020 [Microcystis aeruginosa NIES-3787]GCL55653.1 hypothetical protein NIES3806_30060 [Microcystis aeruginosa NIES-3806]GCL60510.1 hypothetical protein NIES3807_36950 [Microcystis aeruginosa NIES-3807]